ncbi:MAG TPA: SDR family oxidoreductase [Kiritimatiellia bacterium]|nr:SDR family oxidoreductase [Kiritimatiellia bacterium]HRU69629.1 SDR family oxidoreductase [Kiritimatiellia bacterium]
MQPFEGKTAIVTGASSGIGRAVALTLASQGAAVALHARRDAELQAVADEIRQGGGRALAVLGDAGQAEAIDALLEAVLSWHGGGGAYDIVVANAGRGLAGGITTSDESQWQELYQTNVLGTAHLLRQTGRYLSQRGCGDIVVISSVVGRNISPFSGFYGSSKFAVSALAEALRREVCAAGVRVSTVLPGIVKSGFQRVAGYTQENFGRTVEAYGKVLEPQDIANGVSWLLAQPPHVHVSEIMIRPTGQNYP